MAPKYSNEEERFRRIANATNDAVWEWEIESGYIWWSDGMTRLFGYSGNDLVDSYAWWKTKVHPADLERVEKSLQDVVKNKESFWSAEYRFKKADGSYAHVIDRGEVAFDKKKNPKVMYGGIKDITAQKLAERKSSERELFYRTILEKAFDGVSIVSPDGKLIYESPANEKLNGFKTGEMMEINVFDLLHPDDRDQLSRDMQKLMSAPGNVLRNTYRFLHKNGSYRYIESNLSNLTHDPAIKGILVNFQDITARVGVEEALKESESRNRLILHSLPDILFVINEKTELIEYFNAHENVFFKEWKNVAGKKLKEALNPVVYNLLLPIISDKENNDVQEILFQQDDIQYYFEIRIINYGSDNMLIIARDISEAKESAAALQEHRERLELALRGADLGVWDWNIKENKIIYNAKWAEMIGYSLEEIDPKVSTWENLIHPDDYPVVEKVLQKHLDGENPFYESEFRMRSKSGEWRWILDRGKVMQRDEHGKPVRASGTHLDITESKNAREALARSEELFRQLFQNIPIGIVIYDKNWDITSINKGFSDIFQYSSKEIEGKNSLEIFYPIKSQEEYNKVINGVEKGKTVKLETERQRKDGKQVPVILYVVPVLLNGELSRVYGIYIDITERKAYEEELRQVTEELLRSNQELEQFAYITSHNLRSPVANLKGLLSLRSHAIPEDQEQMIMDKVEHSVLQLDTTLQDLIEIVTLKNSLHEKCEEIAFESIVSTVCSDIEESIKNTGAKIETDFSQVSAINYPVSHLQSIFLNLFTNAIKYRSPDRKPEIRISSFEKNGFICISFKDNGVGIDLNKHSAKLFKMYQRLHKNTDGKGLGLYIIKNQLEMLGGKIEVQSEVGNGTEFIIYLKDKPV